MEQFLSVFLGLGLAAASGFRVFVPLLIISTASLLGFYHFGVGFEWMGTWTAFTILLSAAIIEIIAYYVPVLDHFLDVIALPASVIAGSILATSFVNSSDPLLKWALGIIVGGGAAGMVQAGTSLLRIGSSATTGGLGNPVIATSENIFSIIISILSLLLPYLMASMVFLLVVYIFKKLFLKKNRLKAP